MLSFRLIKARSEEEASCKLGKSCVSTLLQALCLCLYLCSVKLAVVQDLQTWIAQ